MLNLKGFHEERRVEHLIPNQISPLFHGSLAMELNASILGIHP
jgi:hypothetical protein